MDGGLEAWCRGLFFNLLLPFHPIQCVFPSHDEFIVRLNSTLLRASIQVSPLLMCIHASCMFMFSVLYNQFHSLATCSRLLLKSHMSSLECETKDLS